MNAFPCTEEPRFTSTPNQKNNSANMSEAVEIKEVDGAFERQFTEPLSEAKDQLNHRVQKIAEAPSSRAEEEGASGSVNPTAYLKHETCDPVVLDDAQTIDEQPKNSADKPDAQTELQCKYEGCTKKKQNNTHGYCMSHYREIGMNVEDREACSDCQNGRCRVHTFVSRCVDYVSTNKSNTGESDDTAKQETENQPIDPTVAHILDFNSDSYAVDYMETLDLCQGQSLHMKRRKAFVLYPDPRPLLGCTWCGPSLKSKNQTLTQIKGDVCPACKHFADQGWERTYLEGASKIIFTRPDGAPMMSSVKDFLRESSRILCPKLGGKVIAPTEQTAPNKVNTAPRTRQKNQGVKEELNVIKRSQRIRKPAKRYTDTRKEKPPIQKLPPKKRNHEEMKSKEVDSTPSSIVRAVDRRPVRGCSWCWSLMGNFICQDCQIFVDQGMTRYRDIPAKAIYFCDSQGKKLYKSIRQYIVSTAPAVLKHKKTHQGDNLPMSEVKVSDQVTKRMIFLKKQVSALDPRPILGCSWCCPKFENEYTLTCGDICSYCKLLPGWSCHVYPTAKHFKLKGQSGVLTPRQFLKMSTTTVCEQIASMTVKEVEALRPLYRPVEVNKSPVKKTVELIPSTTNVSSAFSMKEEPPQKKNAIIELPTITQLIEQENGLMGVLQDDIFQIYNTHFGSNQTVACKILLCLGSGAIPSCVYKETPFQQQDLETAKYVGVVPSVSSEKTRSKYGVAIPQFYVDSTKLQNSKIQYRVKDYIIPRETMVYGQKLLIRNDIDDRRLAGQLFAFMYRVLYGSKMVASVVSDYGSTSDQEAF